jgi:hypothetical protein
MATVLETQLYQRWKGEVTLIGKVMTTVHFRCKTKKDELSMKNHLMIYKVARLTVNFEKQSGIVSLFSN